MTKKFHGTEVPDYAKHKNEHNYEKNVATYGLVQSKKQAFYKCKHLK